MAMEAGERNAAFRIGKGIAPQALYQKHAFQLLRICEM